MTKRWNKELFKYENIHQEEPQIQSQTIGNINIYGNNNVININRDTITINKSNINRDTITKKTTNKTKSYKIPKLKKKRRNLRAVVS